MPPNSMSGSTSDEQRLFVALWPGDAVREQLASYRRQWPLGSSARHSADEGLHLTLHFIGAYPRARRPSLDDALNEVRAERFKLSLGEPTVWRGGIAVLLASPHEALSHLHARVGAALSKLGVTLDARPFAPHITFARRAAPELPAVPACIEWVADDFVLTESLTAPTRGYRVLRHYR